MTVRIFVPRWMDQANTNAQNANAKALLSRFCDPRARWTAMYTRDPAESIRASKLVDLCSTWPRSWQCELTLAYQTKFDAIFYPGPHWSDEAGLRLRRLTGRRTFVIATVEGIIASPDSVRQLSAMAGHPVFAQPGTESVVPRIRWLYKTADHIIAISPFLARVTKFLYGDKVSCLPLGIESGVFHSVERHEPGRCRVVGCGTVKPSKRPEMFLRLAAAYANADFLWCGDGLMLRELAGRARQMGLNNLRFAGALSPERLAEEFRNSSLLVLPSQAEGVPKVTQEAAACGLPIVVNGFYETPTVVHGQNGLVAWSDQELIAHVGTLIQDSKTRLEMGRTSTEMASAWNWDRIAPQWEDLIIRLSS